MTVTVTPTGPTSGHRGKVIYEVIADTDKEFQEAWERFTQGFGWGYSPSRVRPKVGEDGKLHGQFHRYASCD